jgi:predicted ATP-grasp superfamily ATP-dependent carboligase
MAAIGDKKQQHGAAIRLGIPTPETHFPASHEEVRSLAGQLSRYPYVIKPIEAHRWRLASQHGIARGRKGILIRNRQDLEEECARIDDIASTMIQEMIPGPAENLFTFLGYFSARSEAVAYCVRSKIRQNPPGLGYCTLTVSCLQDAVTEASIRMLTELGYYGLVGVEFKRDPRDGEYRMLEINPRAVNTIGLAAGCGVDLPYIAFQDATGGSVPSSSSWESDVKWLWLAQDLWAARELRSEGRLTVMDWLRSLRGKRVHALFARDDLVPFLRYYSRFAREILTLAFRRMRR